MPSTVPHVRTKVTPSGCLPATRRADTLFHGRSGVEPQAQPVERPQPRTAPSVVRIRAGQPAAGQLDAGPPEGLGREWPRATTHHLESFPFVPPPGQQSRHTCAPNLEAPTPSPV